MVWQVQLGDGGPLQGLVLGRQLQLQLFLLSHVVLADHDCKLSIKWICNGPHLQHCPLSLASSPAGVAPHVAMAGNPLLKNCCNSFIISVIPLLIAPCSQLAHRSLLDTALVCFEVPTQGNANVDVPGQVMREVCICLPSSA